MRLQVSSSTSARMAPRGFPFQVAERSRRAGGGEAEGLPSPFSLSKAVGGALPSPPPAPQSAFATAPNKGWRCGPSLPLRRTARRALDFPFSESPTTRASAAPLPPLRLRAPPLVSLTGASPREFTPSTRAPSCVGQKEGRGSFSSRHGVDFVASRPVLSRQGKKARCLFALSWERERPRRRGCWITPLHTARKRQVEPLPFRGAR